MTATDGEHPPRYRDHRCDHGRGRDPSSAFGAQGSSTILSRNVNPAPANSAIRADSCGIAFVTPPVRRTSPMNPQTALTRLCAWRATPSIHRLGRASLHRRTWHQAKRAEDPSVAGRWPERRATARTPVEELTRIHRHRQRLSRLPPTRITRGASALPYADALVYASMRMRRGCAPLSRLTPVVATAFSRTR